MIFFQLFWNFFLIGLFAFGGGYAILSLIDQRITEKGWMATDQLTEIIGISGMIPGSIGTNVAAFIGYKTAGVGGAIVASFGIVFPSLFLVLIFGQRFSQFLESKATIQAFYGLKPVIVGLIFYSSIKVILSMDVVDSFSIQSFYFFVILSFSAILIFLKKTNPIIILILSGLLGVIFFY